MKVTVRQHVPDEWILEFKKQNNIYILNSTDLDTHMEPCPHCSEYVFIGRVAEISLALALTDQDQCNRIQAERIINEATNTTDK